VSRGIPAPVDEHRGSVRESGAFLYLSRNMLIARAGLLPPKEDMLCQQGGPPL
jgi:hypothetical protein